MLINDPAVWKAVFACLQIGLIGWAIVRLIQRGRVFDCPECKEQISTNNITENGIDCPICGWRAVADSGAFQLGDQHAIQPVNDCSCCHRRLATTDCVKLFDGKVYGCDCIDAVSPELGNYAKTHPVLEDFKPRSFRNVLWSAGCLTTMLAGLMTMLFLIVSILAVAVGDVEFHAARLFRIGLMFFGFSWAFFAVVAFPLMFFWVFKFLPRTVRIKDGRLWIQPPSDQYWELDEIRWAEASGAHDMVEGVHWPRRQGIVIFPHNDKQRQRFGYLVGIDSASRILWRDFLTFANVTIQ